MSNQSYEAPGPPTPEYPDALQQLHKAASAAMDDNGELVTYDLLGKPLSYLDLRSKTDAIILLDRPIENPLPRDPEWGKVTPEISKFEIDDASKEWQHIYRMVEGGILISYTYALSKTHKRVKLEKQTMVTAHDLVNLTEEIRTATPIEPPWVKKARLIPANYAADVLWGNIFPKIKVG